MNIVVLQENFTAALSKASRFLPTKTSVSSINNFLLSAEKGEIILQTTDLETHYKTTIAGKVIEEGNILVPAKPALSLFSLFSGEKLTLKQEKNKLVIQGEKSRSSLLTEKAEGFPSFEEDNGSQKLTLKKTKLEQIVAKNG